MKPLPVRRGWRSGAGGGTPAEHATASDRLGRTRGGNSIAFLPEAISKGGDRDGIRRGPWRGRDGRPGTESRLPIQPPRGPPGIPKPTGDGTDLYAFVSPD